jgi:hypothetical protein
MFRRFALLGASLSCAVLLSGCLAVQQLPNGQLSVTPVIPGVTSTATPVSLGDGTAAGAPAKKGEASVSATASMVGSQLESGPWKVLLEKAASARSLPDGKKPSVGKQLIVIDVAFRNTGLSSALQVLPKHFSLKDASGNTLKPFATSLAAFNAQSMRPLDARLGQTTTFVYEIPSGSSGYVFTFAPGQGATSPMRWAVP